MVMREQKRQDREVGRFTRRVRKCGLSCRKAFVHRINGRRRNEQSYLVGSSFAAFKACFLAMPGWDFLETRLKVY